MINKITATIPQLDKGLVAFHASWHQVNWDHWIHSAETSLDIAVFYWDKWTQTHYQALTQFLEKKKTKLRFYLTDESHPELLKQIQGLFPDHNGDEIRKKIANTTAPLIDYLESRGLPKEKLEIRKVPRVLTYPLQVIDGRYAVVSLFEMYRDKHADSPAFIIDMEQSPELKKFFLKELHCLLHEQDFTA